MPRTRPLHLTDSASIGSPILLSADAVRASQNKLESIPVHLANRTIEHTCYDLEGIFKIASVSSRPPPWDMTCASQLP
eukprot:4017500-Amphidinium_carterae.1